MSVVVDQQPTGALSMNSQIMQGVIHGDTIHLDQPSELPAGTSVRIVVMPNAAAATTPTGEGLHRAFGAWAEFGEELDKFLEDNRALRQIERKELGE